MSQTLPKLILQPFIIAYYSYKTFTGSVRQYLSYIIMWCNNNTLVCVLIVVIWICFLLRRLGWYGVLGIYGFFIVFTFINKFVMGPIVALIFTQEKMEGNFR